MRVYLKGDDLLGMNRGGKVIFYKKELVRCGRCGSAFLFGDFGNHRCLKINWRKPWDRFKVLFLNNRRAIMLS